MECKCSLPSVYFRPKSCFSIAATRLEAFLSEDNFSHNKGIFDSLLMPESCYKWDKAEQAPSYVDAPSRTSTSCYRGMVPSIALTSCPWWSLLFILFFKLLRYLENNVRPRRSNFKGIDWSTPGFIPCNAFWQDFRMLYLDGDCFL